jgi:D-threo-aldose 1-dehydrogenase
MPSQGIATRQLGRTGIELPILGLGAAPLGELFEIIPEDRAQAILNTAWDGGIRYYDTAPWYGHGQSEHRVGHMLRQKPRDSFVLSTKVGRVYRAAASATHRIDPWVGGLPFELNFDYSYDGIMRSYEDSLMRLGLNRVDLLVIHDLDSGYHGVGDVLNRHKRDLETTGWRALEELRSSGAIRGIGAGINDADMIPYFLEGFDLDYLLVAMPYTLLDQSTLNDSLQRCVANQVSVVIGSPYASGILATGPIDGALYRYSAASEEILERTRAIDAVCNLYDVRLQAAALQFPLGLEVVVSVIPGATLPAHVNANIENLGASIPEDFWLHLKKMKLVADDNSATRGAVGTGSR